VLEVNETGEFKMELWLLLDSQRHGYFSVICRTIYEVQLRKNIKEKVIR